MANPACGCGHVESGPIGAVLGVGVDDGGG